jgi:pyruvate-ferredoxin/flavodoxin oxidoreductase
MNKRSQVTLDGNEAAAYVAFRTNEVIAIYPITPSSNMGEHSDAWAAEGKKNLWGAVPIVQEMQSEAGAAGAIHGSLQAGALSTTFTASQGLLLMIPNMFKIAGELTSTVFHISARAVACQALSIFGDHSDAMAVRNTGWGMMFSNSVQEVMDMALMAQASTLRGRVPILHAFDGFRTSHEVQKIEILTDEDMLAMLDSDLIRAHRERALSPDRPIMRGTAQNPDVYFQGREAANKFYEAMPDVVQGEMDRFAKLVGRQYHLFDYAGAADAERVVVAMGSGAETVEETVENLVGNGEKVGIVKVRLYRPFSAKHLLAALPSTVKTIAVLDRTKEPGSAGEPLYQDVLTAVAQGVADGTAPFAAMPRVFGGRYGLGSKEFTPGMAKAVFDEAKKDAPKNSFTVGITDDNSGTSLDYDAAFENTTEGLVEAMFWGLGADGTVGANKNSVKIIGEETPNYAQGYFVYDSKKSGNVTTSHLRFGPKPIHSPYLINKASFVAVHQFTLLEAYPVLDNAKEGATFLLNAHFSANEVWDHIPLKVQQQIIEKKLKMWVMDAYDVAKRTNMGARINTIMQTAFFKLSGILPEQEAIEKIRYTIQKTYGKRGQAVVDQNFAAVDHALANLVELEVPVFATSTIEPKPVVSPKAPKFVQEVTAELIAGRGDSVPTSKMPVDGTFPTGTTQWEKRNITFNIPVWEPDLCIQCGKCNMVCPHGVIRCKVYDKAESGNAPATFKSTATRGWKELADQVFTIQVSPEDCTGCELCVQVCPAKDKSNVSRKAINMAPQAPLLEAEKANWEFFLALPDSPKHSETLKYNSVKNVQLLQPMFEFSGACGGCGETAYVKLVSQLFGDRAIIANATGCSSIYGGNLPTTPWSQNKEGRGPSWNNSLFEDCAEFGFGMRLAIDHQRRYAEQLVRQLEGTIGATLAAELLADETAMDNGIEIKRAKVAELKKKLAGSADAAAKDLLSVADMLVKKSVWMMGGDGWAYDIGYGGLDHVIANNHDVNLLVLDTEVYSNTGGQASKATARGAVAKFAMSGKPCVKKDLGRMAMTYGNVYVAQVAMGANDTQLVRALVEAEAHKGPSLVICYCHCIAHGIDMRKGLAQQELAVKSGHWLLYRYNPALAEQGQNPLQLDSREASIPLKDYVYSETRYRMLVQSDPVAAERLLKEAEADVQKRWAIYKSMAAAKEQN